MGFVKAQIQTMLQDVVSGELSFDDYFEIMLDDPPSLQLQLRAAVDQRRKAGWDDIELQLVTTELRDEYSPKGAEVEGDRSQVAGETFDAFAHKDGQRVLPPGWTLDARGIAVCVRPSEAPNVTGKVEPAKPGKARKGGRKAKAIDPTRHKSGRFLDHVAEVWGYDPESGLICRVVFADDPRTNIAKAHALAADIERQWSNLGVRGVPCAWVKYRRGEMKGNKNVFLASGRGMIANPDSITRLHAQAKAQGHSAPVGEKLCKTAQKHVVAMIGQNKLYQGCCGGSLCLDAPSVEPEDPNELVYSIRYQSGNCREIIALPLSDDTDEEGKVTMAGHRKRAMRLLLDSPSVGADSPASIKYALHGQGEKPVYHFVRRSEAIEWAEEEDAEDPRVSSLHVQFCDGDLEEEEYFLQLARLKQEISPVYRERKRQPVCFTPKTRVDYENGRHVWGGTKSGKRGGKSPGAAWVAGQRNFEAQIYLM